MIVLDFALPADAAELLPRLRLLAPLRAGRARTLPRRTVWHDGADGALAARGLALAENREGWQLERLLPAAADATERWAPATAAPVLAAAPTADALSATLPAPLLPRAAFEGRATTIPLALGAETVSLTLLSGRLRTVTGEHRSARLLIAGPGHAAGQVALAIAAALPLSVPRCSLAAEALAIMQGTPPPPRALGAPVLSQLASVAGGLRWIVGHLADVLLHWAPLAHAGQADGEPVHQMRVALRRLRAALAVFRDVLPADDTAGLREGLRRLNAVLGPARDWDVFTAGTGAAVGAALADHKPIGRLLAAAERRRLACYAALRAALDAPSFRQLSIRLALFAAADVPARAMADAEPTGVEANSADPASAEAPALRAFATDALNRTLKKFVQDIDDLDNLSVEELHALRLRGKRLRYTAEFFAPLYPGRGARRFLRRMAALQDGLGALNDGATVAGLLAQLPGHDGKHAFAFGAVTGFAAARAAATRTALPQLWRRFRRLDPFWR